ncbi:MAG: FAD:protein FMN transferase [Candidatus Peregrinibacteria bacterium]
MYESVREVLGTSVRIVVHSPASSPIPAIGNAFQEAFRIEKTYSRFLSGNILDEMNRNLGKWQTVSPECFFLLKTGKMLEDQTSGAFSLSVKTVLESWGYNAQYELGKEYGNGETGAFELQGDREVFLRAPIEFGSIGKGYALDQMEKILSDFPHVFINAGGDIYARGKNEADEPWKCFFEHPLDATKSMGEVEVDNFFLASSSPLKRRWRNRHHLVDARTKTPAQNMLFCSAQATTGIMADGYSTALFALGYDDAQILCKTEGLQALLISKEEEIFLSPGFLGEIQANGE